MRRRASEIEEPPKVLVPVAKAEEAAREHGAGLEEVSEDRRLRVLLQCAEENFFNHLRRRNNTHQTNAASTNRNQCTQET